MISLQGNIEAISDSAKIGLTANSEEILINIEGELPPSAIGKPTLKNLWKTYQFARKTGVRIHLVSNGTSILRFDKIVPYINIRESWKLYKQLSTQK